MHAEEFLKDPAEFAYVDVKQQRQTLHLDAGSLAYTVCQVPVVHRQGDQPHIEVVLTNGESQRVEGLVLDREVSRKIFRRTHDVAQLTVVA
jgi:hypothetical protein